MSVYNGFVTREQESSYNKNLYSLIFLVQNGLAEILQSGVDLPASFKNQEFTKYFKIIYEKVTKEEQYKYVPPKFGMAFKNLADYFGLDTGKADKISNVLEKNKQVKYRQNMASEKIVHF